MNQAECSSSYRHSKTTRDGRDMADINSNRETLGSEARSQKRNERQAANTEGSPFTKE